MIPSSDSPRRRSASSSAGRDVAIRCKSLAEVREQIDRIDPQIVKLLAERGDYVLQAAQFKASPEEVRAPERVEDVVRKVRNHALEHDLDPELVEQVYRPMIARFIESELREYDRARRPTSRQAE